jgi:bifunctional ADP-heptose synthase (sugar kinase/adenylyltransferase)
LLACVDYVAAISEDAPYEVIRAPFPDVFVTGSHDTRAAALAEELAVCILPHLEKCSSTGFINRIQVAHPPDMTLRET